ncbi:alginate export family protein [Acetobacter sp. AN02]|uniref:alginate export family protein n=1 Tax=Acetobacter sp. AN02 TaxID=2894186 RepID=UPI00243458B2|nr:alginate export family protein [Acetobacter sp. AN02]MDG6094813.1 alginate export family protein [Acetobacter sp. AN02]
MTIYHRGLRPACRSRLAGLLTSTAGCFAVFLCGSVPNGSAHAETAPGSSIVQHGVITPMHHEAMQQNSNNFGSRSVPSQDRGKTGFWNNTLLPTLDSRPELYAQPQNLQRNVASPALLHQGPWGIFNSNTGAAAGFGTVGYYAVSRWAEDWSNLRDPKNRIDFLDPLKYIPFNNSGSVYLTLSANFRQHNFYDQHPFFGTNGLKHTLRTQFRWNAGADLHLGEHLRLYGELMSGQAGGTRYFGYNNGRWRSKLDAQQAFVEVHGKLFHAQTGVMVGRMTFLDMPPYISAGSVYPTIPYSWNGIRGYAFWKNFRVDLFDLTMTNWTLQNVPFRDQVGYKTRLFGAYTSYAVPSFKFLGVKSQIFVDTFYLGYILANSNVYTGAGTQAGSTRRDTPGMRVWGNAGPLEFSAGWMWQGGYFHAANNAYRRGVSAYAITSQVSWRFRKTWGKPAVGLQVDKFSGGNSQKSRTSDWGNFLNPFVPSAYYTDISTYTGNTNLIDVGPIATVTTSRNTSLLMKVHAMWRANTHDAVYSNPTGVYAASPKVHGSYIGTAPQASFTWRVTRHVTFSVDAMYFFLGSGMRDAGLKSGAYAQSNLELTL